MWLLPDESTAVVPEPSLNPYSATSAILQNIPGGAVRDEHDRCVLLVNRKASLAVDGVATRTRRVGVVVVTRATNQHVSAILTHQRVVPVATDEDVIARATEGAVAARGTKNVYGRKTDMR